MQTATFHAQEEVMSAANFPVMLGRGRSSESIDRERALSLMDEHGVVLFRGYAIDDAGFLELSDRFCYHFLEHAAVELRPRRSEDGTVASVVGGNGPISLHAEMNYSPERPDLLWFHCLEPAARGGDTLLADARSVLRALAPETRRAFESKRIRYRHLRPPSDWQRLSKLSERAHVIALASMMPDVVARPVEPDFIELDFFADAIRPTGRDGQLGFINSIENILEYADQAATQVSFDDGEPFSRALLSDVNRAVMSVAKPQRLEAGDVVLIDNTRMMHGRTAFEGDRRRINARFGLRNPEVN